jgi:hypothetical protein
MADIDNAALASVGAVNLNNGDIDYITAADAVYFINTNRPTRNLAARDEILQTKINELVSKLNAARGSETDIAARLAVSVEADGSLKASALPDVSSLSSEVTAARAGEASLNDRIQLVDGKADDAVATSQAAVATHEANFIARAEAVRKVTPSGYSAQGATADASISMSSLAGIYASGGVGANALRMGDPGSGQELTRLVVNGYSISLKYLSSNWFDVLLPAPPTSGTRQDLIFIEAWKEEVDKDNGLFFAYGNTQYASSTSVDGATLSDNPTFSAGSAYFIASNGVYAVEASSAPADFISNPDHNIGVLGNGNYFQIRYRIRVEADFTVKSPTTGLSTLDYMFDGSAGTNWSSVIRPQGQLASAPARGDHMTAEGAFYSQNNPHDSQGAYSFVDDKGIYVGSQWNGGNGDSPISGLSHDGFTYAIPICAVHRRNTDVYDRLSNANGTAFEDAWIVDFSNANPGRLQPHGVNGQSLVTIGSTEYKVLETSSLTNKARLSYLSGTLAAPSGTGSHNYNGSPESFTFSNPIIDDGSFVSGAGTSFYIRPDGLYSDIIDRRDVLDLRHKVSLKGDFDEDALYQETFDLIMKGEYRQEWEQLTAFDNDGNGSNTVETGIYGNVLMESLGLGATVPDAGVNTHITRKEECNNGIGLGFNGSRSFFSDKEGTEDFTVYIEDQSDGIASKTHGSEDGGMISYNSASKSIEIDLTQHSSYVNDIEKDPTLLSGHLPKVKWGNGSNVAGVWTKNNDYNWSFEIKEYGSIVVDVLGGSMTTDLRKGAVYEDPNGNRWECYTTNYSAEESGSSGSTLKIFTPVYGQNDYTLPANGSSWTLISGIGANPMTLRGGAELYVDGNSAWLSDSLTGPVGTQNIRDTLKAQTHPRGYSNSAHGTSATESVFATYKLNYKAGSSCLPELPYGDDMIVKGASLFLDGTEVTLPESVRPMGGYDKNTKTVNLTGLASRKPVATSGDGYHQIHAPQVFREGNNYVMLAAAQDTSNRWFIRKFTGSTDSITFAQEENLNLEVVSGEGATEWHNCPRIIKLGGTYHLFFSAQTSLDPGVWRLYYSTSTDLTSWSQGQLCSISRVLVHFGVLYEDSKFKILNSDGGGYYQESSDGITFTTEEAISPAMGPSSFSMFKDGEVYQVFYGTSSGVYHYTTSDLKIGSSSPTQVHVSQNSNYGTAAYHHVMKDDKSYKMWVSELQGNSSNIWEIHYAVLAMSDPNNVGSSLTGVYTNTSPQVNLGFKANDTVVLNYERKAFQTEALGGEVEYVGKHVVVNENKVAGMHKYSWGVFNYEQQFQSPSQIDPSEFGYGIGDALRDSPYQDPEARDMQLCDWDNLSSRVPRRFKGTLTVQTESWSKSKNSERIFIYTEDIDTNSSGSWISETIDTLEQAAWTFHSLRSKSKGSLHILIGLMLRSNYDVLYMAGSVGISQPMIGRPLIK